MNSAPPPLSADQLAELLALVQEVDSVELKLTVPEAARRSTVEALDIDPLDAQLRQVYFFDTPELLLDANGLVVRARRTQGRGEDSVVKLRPVVPSELDNRLRELPDFGVEVDALPGGFVCSASYKSDLDKPRVRATMAGDGPLRKLFTKGQRAFFDAYAPDGIGLDDLSVLGPINVFKLRFTPDMLQRKVVGEMWFYPDGSRIVELSTKCRPPELEKVVAEVRAILDERGIDLTGEQQTKTKTALEFFSKELRA